MSDVQIRNKIAWIYLWAFYFVPLFYISVFVPVPYCLDDCGFVVEPEVRQVDSSSSNCCFFICIQVSQEGGKVVSYFHLLKNFPQFIVIYTVEGFSVVNEADVFLEFSCFFNDPVDVGSWISGSSAFSKSSLNF